MQTERFSISALANMYGLSLRTLRFYEQRGLLNPVRIGTQRFYVGKDRVTLELILKGKRFGFSLSEIERLISAAPKSETDTSSGGDITHHLDLELEVIQRQLEHLSRKRDDVELAIGELKRRLDSQD